MSVNKVILVGNVGADPEVRAVANDNLVAHFRLATTERGYKTANGNVVEDRTEWHNIVVWRGLAKVVEQYVRKGTQLYIEGKIQTRSWKDQQGNDRYTTEIVADNMELLGRRADGATPALSPAPAVKAEPAGKTAAKAAAPKQDAPQAEDIPFDNSGSGDLPF